MWSDEREPTVSHCMGRGAPLSGSCSDALSPRHRSRSCLPPCFGKLLQQERLAMAWILEALIGAMLRIAGSMRR